MQIGAVSSTSFQGINTRSRNYDQPIYLDGVEAAKEKASKNVHLLTIGLGSATALMAIAKGKNCVALATRAVATTGEALTKGAVKAGSAAINLFKKESPVNPEKTLNKIGNIATFLRNDKAPANEKFVNGVETFVGNILGKEKGEAVGKYLVKNNMANPVGAVQGGIGAVIGLQLADKASDKVENVLDQKDISNAQQAENKKYEMLETLMDISEGLSV